MIGTDVVAARGLEIVLVGAAVHGCRPRIPAMRFVDPVIALGTGVLLGWMGRRRSGAGTAVLTTTMITAAAVFVLRDGQIRRASQNHAQGRRPCNLRNACHDCISFSSSNIGS